MKTLLSGVTKLTSRPISLTESLPQGWTVSLTNAKGRREVKSFGVYPSALAFYQSLAVNPLAKH